MTGETYDMQKLGEAVSALAVGTGTIQERVRDALIPLAQLSAGGLHDKELSAELERIRLGTTYGNVMKLSEEDARALARSIVELQIQCWQHALWELEDRDAS